MFEKSEPISVDEIAEAYAVADEYPLAKRDDTTSKVTSHAYVVASRLRRRLDDDEIMRLRISDTSISIDAAMDDVSAVLSEDVGGLDIDRKETEVAIVTVSTKVGSTVGIDEGSEIGCIVGLAVIFFVGAEVGSDVGAIGCLVGLRVGTFVGIRIGWDVGPIGCFVGLDVGAFVGCEVAGAVRVHSEVIFTVPLDSAQPAHTDKLETPSLTATMVCPLLSFMRDPEQRDADDEKVPPVTSNT